jgi:hypothetical protein
MPSWIRIPNTDPDQLTCLYPDPIRIRNFFCGSLLPSWTRIPNPDPLTLFNPDTIRIRNTGCQQGTPPTNASFRSSEKLSFLTQVVSIGATPRLILVARQDIPADTELLYDYGDR